MKAGFHPNSRPALEAKGATAELKIRNSKKPTGALLSDFAIEGESIEEHLQTLKAPNLLARGFQTNLGCQDLQGFQLPHGCRMGSSVSRVV